MENKIPVELIDPEVYEMLLSKGIFPLRAIAEDPTLYPFGELQFYFMDDKGNYYGTTHLPTVTLQVGGKTAYSCKFDFNIDNGRAETTQ